MNSALLGLAIAHGGLSQVIVGLMMFFKGNTFCHVVFCSFGAFWWAASILLTMPAIAPTAFPAPDGHVMGAFFLLWGIFTFVCWICTFQHNRTTFYIFAIVWPTFLLLSLAHWKNDAATLKAGGWLGLVCGCLAFYLGLAELLNETTGCLLLPIGEPKNLKQERSCFQNWIYLFGEHGQVEKNDGFLTA